MSAKDRIEIDFARAINQAESLEEMAGILSSMAKESFEEALLKVAGIWRGDNADFFRERGVDIIPGILMTADELMRVAGNVRYTAQVVYEAEKRAAGLI